MAVCFEIKFGRRRKTKIIIIIKIKTHSKLILSKFGPKGS
jgi:hypothetical protein